MSAPMRVPSGSPINGPNTSTSRRISRRLDDQQRLAAVIFGRDQQEARRAAERVQLVRHAVGLEGRILGWRTSICARRSPPVSIARSDALLPDAARHWRGLSTGRPSEREAMRPHRPTNATVLHRASSLSNRAFRRIVGRSRREIGIVRPLARAAMPSALSNRAAAVGAAMRGFDQVFRMRHQAEHVAALVDDARRCR